MGSFQNFLKTCLCLQKPVRKKKKYIVDYLVMCGWGVMEDEFECTAYNAKEAHQKFLAANITGVYGDREKLKSFKHMKEDIREITNP